MNEETSGEDNSQRNYLIVLAVASMAGGFAFTYFLEFTEGWSVARRFGGALLFGLWCTFMVTVTRAGSGVK